MAPGLYLLLRSVFGGRETAPLAYLLLVIIGIVLFVVGGAVGRKRHLLVVASVMAGATMSVMGWLMMTEKPPPCAEDVTEAGSLAYLRPWLQGIGYSPSDVDSFYVNVIVKEPEQAWPTYYFYFTGTKNGSAQGVTGVGNGCGIGELQEAEPLTVTKVQ
jgi:hypothetical protein